MKYHLYFKKVKSQWWILRSDTEKWIATVYDYAHALSIVDAWNEKFFNRPVSKDASESAATRL